MYGKGGMCCAVCHPQYMVCLLPWSKCVVCVRPCMSWDGIKAGIFENWSTTHQLNHCVVGQRKSRKLGLNIIVCLYFLENKGE